MKSPSELSKELETVQSLLDTLSRANSFAEKIDMLDANERVQHFFSSPSLVRTFLSGLSLECAYVIKGVVAIGQGERLFDISDNLLNPAEKFRELLDQLMSIELFYQDLGGIIGYQKRILELLLSHRRDSSNPSGVSFLPPKAIDIREQGSDVHAAVFEGIKRLSEMGEVYPLGGAGDRLGLTENGTGKLLPASRLKFVGRTLLEGLIRDLSAREYLYYKLFGKKIITPIAIMTSNEKENHKHVLSICEENSWFGRPKESFNLFNQPSVPTFNEEGDWCLKDPLSLLLKPGGHGAVWKLALEEGVFDWFTDQGRKTILVRQINNPIAGIDYGILAFMGFGHKENKVFGFASCPRKINTREGVNVIKSIHEKSDTYSFVSNIEYCDFHRYGIEDIPISEENDISQFPSNTNILFAKISELALMTKKLPYPGILINFKEHRHYDPSSGYITTPTARIESTMQNIADSLGTLGSDSLKAYITFNHRYKTISAVKNSSIGKKGIETPQSCFLDFLRNAKELLADHCGFTLPEVSNAAVPFVFTYHPALGPLYSIIGQKIRGGKLEKRAELSLEIVDVLIENLTVKGSFLLEALSPLEERAGNCLLKNVTIENLGIDFHSEENVFWKSEITRQEACKILLHPGSELIAEDVTFTGNMIIEVPQNRRWIAEQVGDSIRFIDEPISVHNPIWEYQFTTLGEITLKTPAVEKVP